MTCRPGALSLLLAGCYVGTDGLEVAVDVRPADPPLGWTFEEADLAVGTPTLHPCGGWSLWPPAIMPVAFAHGGAAADADSVRVALDLPGRQPLAPARPAPGRACAVSLPMATLDGRPTASWRVHARHDDGREVHSVGLGGTVFAFLDAPLDVHRDTAARVVVMLPDLGPALDGDTAEAPLSDTLERGGVAWWE